MITYLKFWSFESVERVIKTLFIFVEFNKMFVFIGCDSLIRQTGKIAITLRELIDKFDFLFLVK